MALATNQRLNTMNTLTAFTLSSLTGGGGRGGGGSSSVERLNLVESLVNGRMAGKRGSLFHAPTPFVRALPALPAFLDEMLALGCGSGIVAFESYNQCHWSTAKGDESYKKHGFIGMGPPSHCLWSKRTHPSEGMVVDRVQARRAGIHVL